MGAARRDRTAALIEELFERPGEFDFFQAVRILEAAAGAGAADGRVGEDNPPARELVRFRTHPSLAFASSDIHGLSRDSEAGGSAEMVVSFLGLVGSAGVLPRHYTALLIERLQLRDPTLRDLLDLFHHRLISLFYCAWRKYRFPVAFERAARAAGGEDRFTSALYSLAGLGQAALRGRTPIGDAAYIHEGGHFARRVRSAAGLELALSDLFDIGVRVDEFQGRWLEIPAAERCLLARRRERSAPRACLGGGATLGGRVWDVQSKIRIVLGPLTSEQFEGLRPGGSANLALRAAAVAYLGQEIDFDLRLLPMAGTSGGMRLRSRAPGRVFELGRNTWLELAGTSTTLRAADFVGGQNLAAAQ